jgi:hypothetical protein
VQGRQHKPQSSKTSKPLKDEEMRIETGVSSHDDVAFDQSIILRQETGSRDSSCAGSDALEKSGAKAEYPA